MKLMFWTAAFYVALGLAAGLYYREYTVAHDFTGDTEMAVVHTHTLVLGMLFFLLLVALDRLFGFTASRKLFGAFYVIYNIGLLLTLAMMMVIGTRTVLGKTAENPALNGMAGLGHILLTVALILFFVCLGVSLMKRDGKTAAVTQSKPSESNASSEANVSSEANG